MSGGRERILGRIGGTLENRAPRAHPGTFPARPAERTSEPTPLGGDASIRVSDLPPQRHDSPLLEQFRDLFEAVGGEVVEFPSQETARAWLEEFASGFDSMVFGATVPAPLRFHGEGAEPSAADLSISMARYAIAETGTLVLDARDGRLVQLLPQTHVVLVWRETLRASLLEFLQEVGEGTLPSALGLHSGPSKSADIGQVVVQGIHGPGRVIAGILEWDRQR